MRRRSVLTAGAAGAAALLVGGTSAEAATLSKAAKAQAASPGDVSWASTPLRDLAARVGLRIGTALIPQDINTPNYAAIGGSQFSVVTPGNGMKWQIVEPTQGVFDWTAGRLKSSISRTRTGSSSAGTRSAGTTSCRTG